MKLEYLHDLTAGGKYKDVVSENLIRLWDFEPKEAKQFQELIKRFIEDVSKLTLILDDQKFIHPVNCRLILRKGKINNGICRLNETDFVCNLDITGYEHMIDLINPFIDDNLGGYQWLDIFAESGEIDFLFSPGGGW